MLGFAAGLLTGLGFGIANGWLVAAGHRVFLDRDPVDGIVGGDAWEQRLHERLRAADAVVCVVTAAYVASPWCNGEVAVARSRGARLIPVLVEPGVEHPLLPADAWDYFCLGNLSYHGRCLTIVWDRRGTKYGRGAGLSVWSDGSKLGESPDLKPLKCNLG